MFVYPAWLLFFLIIGLPLAWSTAPSQVQGVRFGWHDAYVRVVFDLQDKIPYRLLPAPDPTRLLVEFSGVDSPPHKSVWRSRSSLVREVHFRQAAPNLIGEIRLAHPGIVRRHFRLGGPPRIAIDIAPQAPPATDQQTAPDRTPPPRSPEAARSLATPEAEPPMPPPPSTAPQTSPQKQGRKHRDTSAITVSPDTLSPGLSQTQLLHLAESQWRQGQLTAAQRSYGTFLDRFPDYPHNHLIMVRLADMLHKQRHLREAIEGYAKVITTYPAREGALISQLRLAELGMQSPDLLPESNEPHFESYHYPLLGLQKLVRTYPASPLANIARFKIGELQLQRDEFQVALTSFRQLLQKSIQPSLLQSVQSKLSQTLQALLAAQQKQGEFVDVLRTFFANQDQLAPEDALHPNLVLPVAISYARLGLFPEAQSLLQQLLEGTATPEQKTPAALEQAHLLSKRGQPRAAMALLEPVIPTTDEPVVRSQVLLVLGELAAQAGQPATAVRYLEMASELVSSPIERVRLLSLLAEAYVAQGDAESGLQASQQCAEVTATPEESLLPEAETCLFHAANLLFAKHRHASALETYRRLLQAFPDTHYRHRALLRMAEIYQELGDEPQITHALTTLRDSSTSSLWQNVAADALHDLAWQKRFRERLATLQNLPMQ